jgi:hypothetical protein
MYNPLQSNFSIFPTICDEQNVVINMGNTATVYGYHSNDRVLG